MIEPGLLKTLGWSDELINAVNGVAAPLRNTPGSDIPVADPSVQFVSSSAIYSDSVLNNVARELRVVAIEDKKKAA